MSLFIDIANAINSIHPLSGFSGGHSFNPLALIKAVNYCHSLGYNKSLLVLQLYCHSIEQIEERLPNILSDVELDLAEFVREPQKIFSVARLLFIRKDKQNILPKLGLGQPDLQPKDLSLFPWFPLHLYQDIPVCLLMRGYTLFGQAQSPDIYLDWCAKECQLREAPLLPNNNPLDSIDEFLSSEIWRNLEIERAVEEALFFLETEFCRMLRLQALRAVSNVYPLSEQDEMKFIGYSDSTEEEIDEIWQKHRQAVARLNIFWNPVTNEYECAQTRA